MSQSDMFKRLGAPLKNNRWSWGSVRDADGAVFLRVWQDGGRKINGNRYIWISDRTPYEGDLGANERLHHTKLIESGSSCYMIMCLAVDTKAIPRKVKSFNAKEVFKGGEVIIIDDSYLIEITSRFPVREVIV